MHAVGSVGEAAVTTAGGVEELVATEAGEVTPTELVGCGAAGAAAIEVPGLGLDLRHRALLCSMGDRVSTSASDGPNISDSPVDVAESPPLAYATVGTAEAAACISERI